MPGFGALRKPLACFRAALDQDKISDGFRFSHFTSHLAGFGARNMESTHAGVSACGCAIRFPYSGGAIVSRRDGRRDIAGIDDRGCCLGHAGLRSVRWFYWALGKGRWLPRVWACAD